MLQVSRTYPLPACADLLYSHLPAVPSQCIVGRTLSKKQALMSVTTKIALQINCKLGGELWAVDLPVSLLTAACTIQCLRSAVRVGLGGG